MGSLTSGEQIVSETEALASPAICTMSPAMAISRDTLTRSPCRVRILVILPVSTFSPARFKAMTGSLTLAMPEEREHIN